MIDWLLLALAIVLIIVGIVGCILPVLPGPPLSFIGMLILHYTRFADFDSNTLLIFGLLALIVQALDYVVPAWGTKKFGGSKYGMWGSIIGLIIGLFFVPAIGPFGIITILAGPFFGAFVGELISGSDKDSAMRAAFGSFIGFLTGTLMKFIASILITVFCVKEVIATTF